MRQKILVALALVVALVGVAAAVQARRSRRAEEKAEKAAATRPMYYTDIQLVDRPSE